MRRAKADAIDGILLIDKPLRLSSNSVLQRARRLLGARKAGHTGTLDPLASGLLPLTVGEATKFSADLLEADKEYEASLVLGVSTSSGDAEGETIAQRPVKVTAQRLAEVLAAFAGPQQQIPPMFSALKHNGRPLYELARAGVTVERPSRAIHIRQIDCLAQEESALRLRVACSKGTYIRVLAHDIGEALGCGAHLGFLRRTKVGPLSLRDAIDLDGLEELPLAARRARLLPVDHLLQGLARVDLAPELAARFRQGQRLTGLSLEAPADAQSRVRVYDAAGALLGLARFASGRLEPERLLALGPETTQDPALVQLEWNET